MGSMSFCHRLGSGYPKYPCMGRPPSAILRFFALLFCYQKPRPHARTQLIPPPHWTLHAHHQTQKTMSPPPLARPWFRLARLAAVLGGGGGADSSSGAARRLACAFDPQEWRPFTLERATPVTHDTKLLRFSLPTPQQTAGLPITSCIMVQGNPHDTDRAMADAPVARPYTPVSSPDMAGAFELLIKRYPQGRVSSYLHSLREGDAVLVKGPFPKLSYRPNMTKRILMLAGGTGLTPMVQLLHRVLDPRTGDATRVTLLLGSRTEGDVLMKEWLAAKAKEHGDRFTVVHVVETSDGFIDAQRIAQHFPGGQDSTPEEAMALVCGPPPFMAALSGDKLPDKSQGPLKGALASLGWRPEQVYKF